MRCSPEISSHVIQCDEVATHVSNELRVTRAFTTALYLLTARLYTVVVASTRVSYVYSARLTPGSSHSNALLFGGRIPRGSTR